MRSDRDVLQSINNPQKGYEQVMSVWHHACITRIIAATSNLTNLTNNLIAANVFSVDGTVTRESLVRKVVPAYVQQIGKVNTSGAVPSDDDLSSFAGKSQGKSFETVAAEAVTANAFQTVTSDFLKHTTEESRKEGVLVSRIMLRIMQVRTYRMSLPNHQKTATQLQDEKAQAYQDLLTWLLSEDIQEQLSLTSKLTKCHIKERITKLHTTLIIPVARREQVFSSFNQFIAVMPSEDEHTQALNSYSQSVKQRIDNAISYWDDSSPTCPHGGRKKAIQAVLKAARSLPFEKLAEVALFLDCCYSLTGQLSGSHIIQPLANLRVNINLLQGRNDPALSTLIKALNQFVDVVEEERFDAVTNDLQMAIIQLPNEDPRKATAQDVLDEARSIKSSLVASSDLSKVTNCLCKVKSKLSNNRQQINSHSQDSIEECAKQKDSLSTIRVADKFAAKLSIFIGVCVLLGGAAIGVATVMGGLVVPGMFAMVIPSAALIGAGIWMIKEGCNRLKNSEAEAQKIPSSHSFLNSVDRFFKPKAVKKEESELEGELSLACNQR